MPLEDFPLSIEELRELAKTRRRSAKTLDLRGLSPEDVQALRQRSQASAGATRKEMLLLKKLRPLLQGMKPELAESLDYSLDTQKMLAKELRGAATGGHEAEVLLRRVAESMGRGGDVRGPLQELPAIETIPEPPGEVRRRAERGSALQKIIDKRGRTIGKRESFPEFNRWPLPVATPYAGTVIPQEDFAGLEMQKKIGNTQARDLWDVEAYKLASNPRLKEWVGDTTRFGAEIRTRDIGSGANVGNRYVYNAIRSLIPAAALPNETLHAAIANSNFNNVVKLLESGGIPELGIALSGEDRLKIIAEHLKGPGRHTPLARLLRASQPDWVADEAFWDAFTQKTGLPTKTAAEGRQLFTGEKGALKAPKGAQIRPFEKPRKPGEELYGSEYYTQVGPPVDAPEQARAESGYWRSFEDRVKRMYEQVKGPGRKVKSSGKTLSWGVRGMGPEGKTATLGKFATKEEAMKLLQEFMQGGLYGNPEVYPLPGAGKMQTIELPGGGSIQIPAEGGGVIPEDRPVVGDPGAKKTARLRRVIKAIEAKKKFKPETLAEGALPKLLRRITNEETQRMGVNLKKLSSGEKARMGLTEKPGTAGKVGGTLGSILTLLMGGLWLRDKLSGRETS